MVEQHRELHLWTIRYCGGFIFRSVLELETMQRKSMGIGNHIFLIALLGGVDLESRVRF